jgi:hypothetical protein
VIDILDNLYKFSRMIRSPILHTQFLKTTSYKKIDWETGIDLIIQYKAVDFNYVNEAFLSFRRENGDPNPIISLEDRYLIRRFAGAITKRRQQFLYWRRHRDKLGIHARPEDFEVSTVVAPETILPARVAVPDDQTPELPPIPEMKILIDRFEALPESSFGKAPLTATTATVFIPTDNLSETGLTTTSFATTARG